MKKQIVAALLMSLLVGLGAAQKSASSSPDSFVIARHTFFDFGPPFDYYEIIRVQGQGDHVIAERALITPVADACFQPATVEYSRATIHKTIEDLLQSRNPCAIPERDLRHERKRCKHCLVFSGVNVNMQVQCGSLQRQLRMDVLDRDLFAAAPGTPANTSWTMSVLEELDRALGPGAMDKPIFALIDTQHVRPQENDLIRDVRLGQYDALFGKEQSVAKIVMDAEKPLPSPPSVSIASVTPEGVITAPLSIYPAIARAARVEGIVEATFDINPDGTLANIAFVDAHRMKMFESGIREALEKWRFPAELAGKSGKVAMRFSLNCPATSSSEVQPAAQ